MCFDHRKSRLSCNMLHMISHIFFFFLDQLLESNDLVLQVGALHCTNNVFWFLFQKHCIVLLFLLVGNTCILRSLLLPKYSLHMASILSNCDYFSVACTNKFDIELQEIKVLSCQVICIHFGKALH